MKCCITCSYNYPRSINTCSHIFLLIRSCWTSENFSSAPYFLEIYITYRSFYRSARDRKFPCVPYLPSEEQDRNQTQDQFLRYYLQIILPLRQRQEISLCVFHILPQKNRIVTKLCSHACNHIFKLFCSQFSFSVSFHFMWWRLEYTLFQLIVMRRSLDCWG